MTAREAPGAIPDPPVPAAARLPPWPVVERSICGRAWQVRAVDQAAALAISQRHDLPEVLGRILAGRGLSPDAVPEFMAPRIGPALPDPSHLLDLDKAVARLADAVVAGETIGLLGDYDVDGATSVAVLARYLGSIEAAFAIDIPDRLREGYGPNPEALDRLRAQGAGLIVTLDCGTTAFAPLEHAAAAGLEVIVVDHHVALPALPPAVAVVNPNRLDQSSPIGDLAAVGVTFVVVVGLNRTLRGRGFFTRRPEPDVRRWLDLVALGTVCDVVPLAGLNRALVSQGLKVMAKGCNAGLVALAGAARVSGQPSADQLGFFLGPRINAGGRVGQSHLGAALLVDDRPEEVTRLALELHQLNEARRTLERQVLERAEAQVEPALARAAPLLVAAGEGWSPGVVGLAAARLTERYRRPALVAGIEDGIAKGSGRSTPGFDLGRAVLAARAAGLLLAGGGHPMAAGFTLAAEQLPAFTAFIEVLVVAELGARPAPTPALELEGTLRIEGASFAFARKLERLAPFGRGNPEPRFMLPDVRVVRARRLGGQHVDCWLTDAVGSRLRGIAFRAADGPLGTMLLEPGPGPVHLAGRLRLDSWNGRHEVTLQIDDAARIGDVALAGSLG